MTQRADRSPQTAPASRTVPSGCARCVFSCMARFTAAASLMLLTLGCSANVASLIFDGVPAPPPPKEYCAPYLASLQPKTNGNGTTNGVNGTAAKRTGSVHPPYQEKRCSDCHDKTKGTGLLYPKNELCFTCHDDIAKGAFVHAPAAAGECLACHLPHDSTFPFLLKAKKGDLCTSCHKEQRISSKLHQRATTLGVACSDCHNPPAGAVRYFLW